MLFSQTESDATSPTTDLSMNSVEQADLGQIQTSALITPSLMETSSNQALESALLNEIIPTAIAPIPFVVTSLADTVDANDGALTLREAIDVANIQQGADVIHFAPELSGTITLSGTQLEIRDDLTIQGDEVMAIAISGNQASRVFEIANQATVNLNYLTLTKGRAVTGGAISTNGYLTLNHCIFAANTASSQGGAVYINNPIGTLIVNDSIFNNNQAARGGGIATSFNKELFVTNSQFNRNSAGRGGAIDSGFTQNTTIENSGFYYNEAISGGGIHSYYSNLNPKSLAVSNSTFSHNQAIGSGGGISTSNYGHQKAQPDRNPVVLTNNTFDANIAGTYGGGVSLEQVATQITNNTFNANKADFGGAIASNSMLTVTNSTIANNIVNDNVSYRYGSGGIGTAGPPAFISNTIIARNGIRSSQSSPVETLKPSDVAGYFVSLGNNLIGNSENAQGFVNNINGDQVGDRGRPIDPKLGALQDNGGPTWTMALLPGSPAIDAVRSGAAPTTDQRGIIRQHGLADIGAVEYGRKPVAQNDVGTVMEGESIALSMLDNDSDADGDTLTIASFTNPAHGTLLQNPDGTFTYTANLNFSGTDMFTYSVNDGVDGNSQLATVAIAINPLNLDGTREANILIGTNTDNQINGKAGEDLLDGQGGNDTLSGGAANDRLFGGDGNDLLKGDAENDALYGGLGDDLLNGGSQDDVLVGGGGNDSLIGSTGDDRYVYSALNEAGDTIQDFMNGNDVLDLRDLFRNLNYQGNDPIANNYLKLAFNAGKTDVQINSDGTSASDFTTLVTLNGITPAQLVLGQTLLV